MKKLYIQISMLISVLFIAILFFGNNQGAKAYTWNLPGGLGWDNNQFLNQNFWNNSPTDEDITQATFGNTENPETIYNSIRNQESLGRSCHDNIQVVYTGNLEPSNLETKTIYVLTNEYNILHTGINIDGDCIAIISNHPNGTTFYSENQIDTAINIENSKFIIIDNISINGTGNQSYPHLANNNGIYIQSESNSITINNSNVFNNANYGIANTEGTNHNIFNHVNTYNNSIGIYINAGQYNIINNIKSYNNSNAGIHFQAATYNTINNSQIFMNNSTGILLAESHNNVLNNSPLYNNDDYILGTHLILLNSNNNIFNNLTCYNGKYISGTGNNNKYYGELKCVILGGINGGLQSDIEIANLTRSNGIQGDTHAHQNNWNYVTNPYNNQGEFLYQWTTPHIVNMFYMVKANPTYNGTITTKYSYGSQTQTQIQPVRYLEDNTLDRWGTDTYNTNHYIGSHVNQVTGEIIGLPISGTAITGHNITITSNDLANGYYNIFGTVTPYLLEKNIGDYNQIYILPQYYNKIIPQIYNNYYYATHRQQTINYTCGINEGPGVGLQVNEWEECDLGNANGPDSACSEYCTWNIPNCNLEVPASVSIGERFTITGNVSNPRTVFSGLDFGNNFYHDFNSLSGIMQTGLEYSYLNIGTYAQTMYVFNPLNSEIFTSCTGETQVVAPNLWINKSINPSTGVTFNDLITYTIEYGNNGDGIAFNNTIIDIIPANLTGDWTHLGIIYNSNIEISIGTLHPGQTGQIILTGYAINSGVIENTASLYNEYHEPVSSTITGVFTDCGNGQIDDLEECDGEEGCNEQCKWITPSCNISVDSPIYSGTYASISGQTQAWANFQSINFGLPNTDHYIWNLGYYHTGYQYYSGGTYSIFMTVANPLNESITNTCSKNILIQYCGDGEINGEEECDLGNANGPDSACSEYCTWNIPNCNLEVPASVGIGERFTITGNVGNPRTVFSGLDFGNNFYHVFNSLSGIMQTGLEYSYLNIGTYVQTMYVFNPLNSEIFTSCTGETQVVAPNLWINKSINPSTGVTFNDLITYTIEYGNEGSDISFDTIITEIFPNYFSGNWDHLGTWNGDKFNINIGNLNPGQTGQIILTGYAINSGIIENIVFIQSQNNEPISSTITGIFTHCGNEQLNNEEECDWGSLNGPNSACSNNCTWNIPSCNLETPATVGIGESFNITGSVNSMRVGFSGLDFGNGFYHNFNNLSGVSYTTIPYTYSMPGNYLQTMYVFNIFNPNSVGICTGTIQVKSPNLSVNKSASITTGCVMESLITYTIDYANLGDVPAINTILYDIIPYNFTGNRDHLGTWEGDILVLFAGTLMPGQTGQIVLTGYATAEGTLTNTINLQSVGHPIITGTTTGTFYQCIPDVNLWITKSMNPNTGLTMNALITYTIDYGNFGPEISFNTILTDDIPNNFTGNWDHLGVINSNTLEITVGQLNPGQAGQIVLTGYATSSGIIENTASIYGDHHEPISSTITGQFISCGNGIVDNGEQCDLGSLNGSNSACSSNCTWNIPTCSLETPANVSIGELFTITGQVNNTRIAFSGLDFGNNFYHDFKGLSGVMQTGLEYSYQSTGNYIQTMYVFNTMNTGTIGICTGHTQIMAPNLTIKKSMSPNTGLTMDSLVTYTISYENNGSGNSYNTIITEQIPNNFTGNWNHLGTWNGNTLEIAIGQLNPGQTGQIVLTGYVTSSGLIENTVSIYGDHNEIVNTTIGGLFIDCGNGIIDSGERCDLGNLNGSNSACSSNCTWNIPTCSLEVPVNVSIDGLFTITGHVNESWGVFSGMSLGNQFYPNWGSTSSNIIINHTYKQTGQHNQTMYVYNYLNTSIMNICTGQTQVVLPNLRTNKFIVPNTGLTMDTLITYIIHYGNSGSGSSYNTIITEHIPSNFTGNWDHLGIWNGNKLYIHIGELKAGEVGQIILTGYATNRGSMTNTSVIHGSNANAKTGNITTTIQKNICGNGIVEIGEYCDDGNLNGTSGYCNTNCSKVLTIKDSPTEDKAGHNSAGVMCKYNDENYYDNGPFTDTITHRGFEYIEIMRKSCLHRGKSSHIGLWQYYPDDKISKAEVLKTLVKIVGIAKNDFDILTEDMLYNGIQIFVDVPSTHRFSWYSSYAYNFGLSNELYSSSNQQKYLQPDNVISRYETIKKIMEVYKKIISNKKIDISGSSNLTDISNKNPYYQYVREAEVLGIIQGERQKNGSYKFIGDRPLTRAEFAKIVSIPFKDLLFTD